jgi:hypothetical protein
VLQRPRGSARRRPPSSAKGRGLLGGDVERHLSPGRRVLLGDEGYDGLAQSPGNKQVYRLREPVLRSFEQLREKCSSAQRLTAAHRDVGTGARLSRPRRADRGTAHRALMRHVSRATLRGVTRRPPRLLPPALYGRAGTGHRGRLSAGACLGSQLPTDLAVRFEGARHCRPRRKRKNTLPTSVWG